MNPLTKESFCGKSGRNVQTHVRWKCHGVTAVMRSPGRSLLNLSMAYHCYGNSKERFSIHQQLSGYCPVHRWRSLGSSACHQAQIFSGWLQVLTIAWAMDRHEGVGIADAAFKCL